MHLLRRAAAALLLSASAVAVSAQQIHLSPVVTGTTDASTPVTAPIKPVSLDLTAIDKTADPCNDFYAYACGNWNRTHSIPADKPAYGTFTQLSDYNLYSLYQLLEQAANHPATPLQTKYGNFYAACMNEPLKDQLGAKPIQPALDRIANWHDKKTLALLAGKLEAQQGYGLFLEFGPEEDQKNSTVYLPTINQGGLSLPDRDYYLQGDDRSKAIRAKYMDILQKMFVLLGDTADKAKSEADAVMKVETALASGSLPRVDQRDPDNVYHVKTVAELEAMSANYRFADYFAELQLPPFQKVNVAEPGFITALNQEIARASEDELRSYLRWHVLSAQAGRLSKPFRDTAFFPSAGVERRTGAGTALEALHERNRQCTGRSRGPGLGR